MSVKSKIQKFYTSTKGLGSGDSFYIEDFFDKDEADHLQQRLMDEVRWGSFNIKGSAVPRLVSVQESLAMYGWTPNIQTFENYINQYNTVKFDDKALPNGKSYSQVLQDYLTYIKANQYVVFSQSTGVKDKYIDVSKNEKDRMTYLIGIMQTNSNYCVQNCGTDVNCQKMKAELNVLKKGGEVMKYFHQKSI